MSRHSPRRDPIPWLAVLTTVALIGGALAVIVFGPSEPPRYHTPLPAGAPHGANALDEVVPAPGIPAQPDNGFSGRLTRTPAAVRTRAGPA